VKILAIRIARLGDVLLLLPSLGSLKERFPDSRLVFLTGHRCAPIAEMCPFIDEVIAVDRIAMRDGPVWTAIGSISRLLRNIRGRHFDIVIDFHSFRETNLLTWLSRAPIRIGMKRHRAAYWGFCFNQPPVVEDKGIHVAEMFQRVVERVPLPVQTRAPAAGKKDALIRVPEVRPHERKLVLYVDAPVPDRIWPPERFAAVADFAIERFNAEVVTVAGTGGAGLAAAVRNASRHPEQISVSSELTLPELAVVIASGRLLVSNDTGPMHIGPAVGVPTLGLFSVGYPEHFRPMGEHDRYLRENPIEKIEVSAVIANVSEMWAIAGRDPRR
jgi:ADP-heptose:LPS heptosyltransferase